MAILRGNLLIDSSAHANNLCFSNEVTSVKIFFNV